MKRKCKSGFTLIELLVVISIIALLLSILMPSLGQVKMKAAGVVCTTRQRSLIIAGTLYSEDNDDFIISSATRSDFDGSWVWGPDQYGISFGDWTIELRKQGIRDGSMWPYVEDIDFYHCPSDDRIKQPEGSGACAFRSYSMPSGLNSWFAHDPLYWTADPASGGTDHYCYTKMSQIKDPSNAMFFLEEAERVNGFNHNSWAMYVTTSMLWDPAAVYHADSSTFGFVDGHSSIHKWKNEETIEMFNEGTKFIMFRPDNEDYVYLEDIFPYARIR